MLNITKYKDDRLSVIIRGTDVGVHVGAFEPAFPGDVAVVDLTIVEPHAVTGNPITSTVRMTQAQARDLAVELLRYVVGA